MKNTLFATSNAGTTRLTTALCLTFALFSSNGRLNAQPNARQFVPFNRFLESARTAKAAGVVRTPETRVKDAAAFEEMRQHVLSLYEGVTVNHSFVIDSIHFDCVPVDQQPTARAFGITETPAAPPQSLLASPTSNDAASDAVTSTAVQANAETQTDEFGNSIGCVDNTIPMRRVTLDELTRFSSLREFFSKGPDAANVVKGRGAAAVSEGVETAPAADPTLGHKYAIMQQNVNNLGGSSTLNIWSPLVDTTKGEVMSLSQEWYVGGSGATTQTAEVGWQVQPSYWRTNSAVMFVYWTANDYDQADYPYSKGAGCYNTTCAGFYQIPGTFILGAPLSASVLGGTQREITAKYYLFGGNWWLAINGQWIGYMPGAIYKGGQMTRNAQVIQFGTETYANAGLWPAAGSGKPASQGAYYAAYQRDLFYISTSGQSYWDTLTPRELAPACYTITQPMVSSGTGSVFFYVGGPGGKGC